MIKLGNWFHQYNEAGFINEKHEKIKKILLIGLFTLIFIIFISLVLWTIMDFTSSR